MGRLVWPALVPLAAASFALVACDGAGEPPFLGETVTPAETANPTTAPTATPTPDASSGTASADFRDFRVYARRVDAAITANDQAFFVDTAVITSIPCGDEFVPQCDEPGREAVEGIWVGLWGSEAFPEAPEEVRQLLSEYFASGARLHSLAAVYRDVGGAIGGPTYFAVLAVASVPESTRVLFFRRVDAAWRLLGLFSGGSLSSEWLSGNCAGCYDYWERWEG